MFKILTLSIFLLHFITFVHLEHFETKDFEFNHLCQEWTYKSFIFDYKLNSYARLKFNFTLPPISYYLEEAPYDFLERKKFRSVINAVYSKNFINGLNSKKIKEKREQLESYQGSFNGQWRPLECVFGHMKCDNDKKLMFPKTKSLLNYLDSLDQNYLLTSLVSENELRDKFIMLIDTVKGKDSQTPTLKDKFFDAYYNMRLTVLDEFTLNSDDRRFYLSPKTTGTLSFSLYVPLQEKEFKRKAEKCDNCFDRKFPGFLSCSNLYEKFSKDS